MKYLLVIGGGGIGSLARYLAGTAITTRFGSVLPLGTMVINITGSFLIGLLMTLLSERLPHPNWLTGAFEETDLTLTVGGQPMKIFQYQTQRDTSLTLGSNAEGATTDCNMYLVIVK